MTATVTTYENIELVITDGVATITISRPKVMNALNNALLRELDNALDAVLVHFGQGCGLHVVGKCYECSLRG